MNPCPSVELPRQTFLSWGRQNITTLIQICQQLDIAPRGGYNLSVSSGRSSVVERLLPKQDIVGSSPIARSKNPLPKRIFLFFWANIASTLPTQPTCNACVTRQEISPCYNLVQGAL
jgi:hypothetical protein